ncbi:hypothetical protein BGZ79_010723 [Entomortierella chlamydospora]|nr:hypothetical protein BGZ79_010723 [Entomortierella chlamydospora]
MWALSFAIGIIAIQVIRKYRVTDERALTLGITTLFALPALREAQPGIPAIGCAADVLGRPFYDCQVKRKRMPFMTSHRHIPSDDVRSLKPNPNSRFYGEGGYEYHHISKDRRYYSEDLRHPGYQHQMQSPQQQQLLDIDESKSITITSFSTATTATATIFPI